jgi:probable F420-dependent oxidoreductase
VKVDAFGYLATIEQGGATAHAAERLGYDGWWAPETMADALMACAVASERTELIELATGITVAFARNPMTVAMQANDVHALSKGRFLLGLGSQIRPHITRRFSMPWSHPAPRMREFVLAVRAIWKTWETGERLDFEGEFYTYTLMTPFFNPGPNPHGNPPVILAAVGPKMTEMAGEVCDGILTHGFSTERYLREVTLPALERGAARGGKTLDGFQISTPGFIIARDSEQEIADGLEFVRQQIGFYGSTPAYRGVLEVHGWGELQEELHALTQKGAWGELASVVTDEVLETFAIAGTPEQVAAEVRHRYGDVANRVSITVPDGADPERWGPVFAALRAPTA